MKNGSTRREKWLSAMLLPVALVMNETAAAEDLWDVYRLALENDARYLAAEADYEAARLDLPLARTVFRPAVNGFGTLGKERSDITGSTVTSESNQLGAGVDLLLFDRARRIGVSQAELQVENALIELDIERDALTLRVSEAYFNLLAARDAKEVARLQKITIKRQMDLAEERLDVGLGTRTDLFDARARFEQANADVIAADILINNARQALIEIINVTPKSIAALEENSPLNLPEPNDIDHWTDLARASNLQVQSRNINLLVASQEVDRQRAGRSPSLNLGADYRYTDGDAGIGGGDGEYSSAGIGLTLNLPLYLGGSINLRTRQAGMRFNAAEQVLEAARRRATSDATAAFLSVTSGISQVEALAEAIVAGESALQAKEEGFSAGLTTNLDVLDAQRDLSRSRVDYLRARYNYILALLQLEQATGDLGDEDIQYINDWLEDRNTAYRTGNDPGGVRVAQYRPDASGNTLSAGVHTEAINE
jgi:outer membrane protein